MRSVYAADSRNRASLPGVRPRVGLPGVRGRHCQRRRQSAPGQGDAADDVITLRLLAGDATQVEVLDSAAVIGTFPRATFLTIVVNGGHGADTILVSDVNGAFTDTQITTITGGDGNDTITGGAGGETSDGGDGNDIDCRARRQRLAAGRRRQRHADGRPGRRSAPRRPRRRPMIWNPGDGSEPVDGEAGTDTFQFNGGAGVDTMTISPNGQRVTFFRHPAHHDGHRHDRERARDAARPATTSCTGSPGLAGLTALTVDGGDGDDTITGGDGNDIHSTAAPDSTSSTAKRATTRSPADRAPTRLRAAQRRPGQRSR